LPSFARAASSHCQVLHEQQARIAKLHEQLKIAKSKIHPRQSHPDNSLQGFFRRQALQNGSSDSLPEEESVSTSLANFSNSYDSSQTSPEEASVSSTASLREALVTWSNRYDGLQY
jgi:hypothetical protein